MGAGAASPLFFTRSLYFLLLHHERNQEEETKGVEGEVHEGEGRRDESKRPGRAVRPSHDYRTPGPCSEAASLAAQPSRNFWIL